MSTTRELHDGAMGLYEQALLAARDGDRSGSLRLFRDALKLEAAAADSVEQDHSLEPTRSVLHRSAATIALKIGDVDTAMRYTEVGLQGSYIPEEIKEELTELRE